MKKINKKALSMFLVFCMLFASVPQAVFASDHENHWAKDAIERCMENGTLIVLPKSVLLS